jgi:exopolysaccharide production protein ExoQ
LQQRSEQFAHLHRFSNASKPDSATAGFQQLMAPTTNKIRKGLLLLPGLVGFVFAFRTCLTILFFQSEPQQGTVVSVALSLTLLVLAAFFSIGRAPSIPTSCFRTPTLYWNGALLGIALASLFWSEAPFVAAAGYWAAWAADVATIWFLLRGGGAEDQAEAVMEGYVWGASAVAVVAWVLPSNYDMRLGDEDFLHPNALGFLFSIATFLAIHLTRRTVIWRLPALFLATTLLRTISKSAIIAFVVAFCFYLIWDSTLSRAVKARIAVAAGVILVSLWGVLEAYLDTYTEGTGPETLTGRTLIWAVSFEYALEKPLLGNGFYAYRFIVPPFGKFEGQEAHNELLQQFFAYGAVGVIFTIALYWTFFRQIRRAPRSNLKNLASSLLVFALIRGLTDTQTFDLSFPLWLISMLSILLAIPVTQPEQRLMLSPLGPEEDSYVYQEHSALIR